MFLKKFDWISPPITLFFRGENSHVSIYSGILSIIAYVLVVVATIYYALEFINRESPKAYFFTRYVEDAGTFPVNSTQMFHFIQVSDPNTNEKVPLDFAAFRIVGFDDAYSDNYMDDPGIVKTKNHWVYGKCNNSSDTKGISYLIDQKYYEESACIRKYYDATKGKYFETNEEGFRWPVILKGCSNPERTYYGIIMQRCDMANQFLKEQGPACKTSSEIDAVVNSVSFNFQIIDHYADMLNYEMPFTKYFYEVTSSITANNFIIQHLNFNPAKMLTHNGFFFDNQVREEAYFFTQNEKQTIIESDVQKQNRTTNGCLIGVYYWMQNTLQYYERNYDRVQDVLSDIGGISSIVLTIVAIINLLIHNFIVILDTEELALKSEQENYSQRELSRRPTILKKANEIMYPPRRPYSVRKQPSYADQQQQPSNYQRLMKDGIDIYANNTFNAYSKEEKTEQYKNLFLRKNNNNNMYNNNMYNNNMYNNNMYNNSMYNNNNVYNNNMSNNNNMFNSNYEINKEISQDNQISFRKYGRNHQNQQRGGAFYRTGTFSEKDTFSRNMKDETSNDKKDYSDHKPLEKQNFNWCKFLGYLICCGRNDKNLSYYEEFRSKLISEENIIQNYMDTYKLLKACNIKKTDLINKDD